LLLALPVLALLLALFVLVLPGLALPLALTRTVARRTALSNLYHDSILEEIVINLLR
jgi:hypothetical protein